MKSPTQHVFASERKDVNQPMCNGLCKKPPPLTYLKEYAATPLDATSNGTMSRAFVNEDAAEQEPRYVLPKRDDPSFDEAAAWALIEGANEGNSRSAELATGYKWGEPKLVPHIEKILARAREEKDERTEELAERFLKKSEK